LFYGRGLHNQKKIEDIFLLLDVVALSYDDRELQIELVQLQIDHEHLTASFMGILAMEFGATVGLASIFYGLYGKPVYFLIPIAVIVLMFSMLVFVYITLWRYENKRKELKRRTEKLRKKYLW